MIEKKTALISSRTIKSMNIAIREVLSQAHVVDSEATRPKARSYSERKPESTKKKNKPQQREHRSLFF